MILFARSATSSSAEVLTFHLIYPKPLYFNKALLCVESTTDILEKLIEEEQKIRERAEELGVRVGPEPPREKPPERVRTVSRPKEEIPSTELTDKELSTLFAETRDILDIYTMDYITEHLDEAKILHEALKDKPYSPDTLVGSRIAQNIQELKARIDAAQERGSPLTALEGFLVDVKRLLDAVDAQDPLEAKRKYADLLRREQSLPKNVDQRVESEIQELLTEIGKKIQRKGKKSSEEIADELLEEISALMGSSTFDPEGYNKVARKFQQVAENLPEDLRLKIRDRIRECYAKMKNIEQTARVEERQREVRTKKFYWDSFASEVEQLKADLERALPGEFFRIYDVYEQLLDSLEHADLSDVPTVQIEKVKDQLDQCYSMLEELRKRA